MCVIFIADQTRPLPDMIERGYNANPRGAGVAWREGGKVHWKKGLKLDEIQELAEALPLPYVVHFRIPSCGGDTPVLCHPFPVETDAPLALEGKTDGYVLFHNGHWTNWKQFSIETAVRRKIRLPAGKWSDTRAMAMAAAYHGLPILELIDEKSVAFGPIDCEVFGRWDKYIPTGVDNDKPIYCSNLGWQSSVRRHGGWNGDEYSQYGTVYTMCRDRNCTEKKESGSDYCKKHQPADVKLESNGGDSKATFRSAGAAPEGGKDQPPAVQESKGGVGEDADTTLMDAKRWAASLNPKPFRTHTALARPSEVVAPSA